MRAAARSRQGGAADPHGGNRALPAPLAELDARPFDQPEQLAPADAIALHHRRHHRILQHLVDARFVRQRVRSGIHVPLLPLQIARGSVIAPACVRAMIAAVLLR